jgi:hypothetical protein
VPPGRLRPPTRRARRPQNLRGSNRRPNPLGPTLNINDLKDMSIRKLTQVAKDLNVAGAQACASRI